MEFDKWIKSQQYGKYSSAAEMAMRQAWEAGALKYSELLRCQAAEIERLRDDVKKWQALAGGAARLAEIGQNRSKRAVRLGLVP
jgi:hypothetical protein